MANPNVAAPTTLQFDNNDGTFTTAMATLISTVASNTVEVIDSGLLTNLTSAGIRITINRGTVALLESCQISGFTAQELGKIVLTEGECLTGKASASSSATYSFEKRIIT